MRSVIGRSAGLVSAYHANYAKLLAFVRHCGMQNDAEDVLQDVWLRIRAIDTPVAEALPYLYRTAYRVLLDHRRRERRAWAREYQWQTADVTATLGTSDAPPADRTLIARESLAAARAGLNALGEPASTIFRRHRIQGETQREIAVELGIGLSTVERHLRRAYRVLLDLRGAHNE